LERTAAPLKEETGEAGAGPSGGAAPKRPDLPYAFRMFRLGLYATILALVGLRLLLYPPVPFLLKTLIGTWYAAAALFFAAFPRKADSRYFLFTLRFVFFIYEITAIVLAMQLLGGSGWLAILFLLFPVFELNLRYPGYAGKLGSMLAVFACSAVTLAEAAGRLPHDPFFGIGDPLYREPGYMAAVFLVASVFLFWWPVSVSSKK
jgi:hypothetical protein